MIPPSPGLHSCLYCCSSGWCSHQGWECPQHHRSRECSTVYGSTGCWHLPPPLAGIPDDHCPVGSLRGLPVGRPWRTPTGIAWNPPPGRPSKVTLGRPLGGDTVQAVFLGNGQTHQLRTIAFPPLGAPPSHARLRERRSQGGFPWRVPKSRPSACSPSRGGSRSPSPPPLSPRLPPRTLTQHR